MKIAVVTEKFDAAGGGAERSTIELCDALMQCGANVTLVAGRIIGEEHPSLRFPVASLNVSGGSHAGWWRRFSQAATQYFSENRFDIMHSLAPLGIADVYQPRGGSLRYSADRHFETFRCPLVRSIKRATAGLNRGRAVRIADERQLCLDPKRPIIAALSHYVGDQFRALYAMPDNRIRVIRGGIDTGKIQNDAVRQAGQLLRQRFDPDNQLAIVVFAAMNFRLKGLDWLIDSAAAAAAKIRVAQTDDIRDFRILVIGPENYSRYWHRAQKAGAAGRVIFMGATSQMPAMLTMADAVVLPTYNDACSRLILEGLAAGRPGITTRFNGAADSLGNGKYGVIIDRCDDREALADAILKIANRNSYQQFRQAIERDGVCSQVTMRRHAEELLTFFADIARQKNVK